ncbi:class I SAM-dependent methyltransferase [Patescibacteria group bacterium]|nr:class I SAM-dependent methyltransferase [Patescibacteria group bacterium]
MEPKSPNPSSGSEQERLIGQTYDELAPTYESKLREIGYRNLHAIKEIMTSEHATHGAVLDLGCGPGNLARVLGPNFTYFGAEVSPRMAERARAMGYADVYERSIEDVLQAIPYEDAFDYVIASSSLQFIAPEKLGDVLLKMRQLARKGVIFTIDGVPQQLRDKMEEATKIKTYSHLSAPAEDIYSIRPGAWATRKHPPTLVERHYNVGWKSPHTGIEVPVQVLAEFYPQQTGTSVLHERKNPWEPTKSLPESELAKWREILIGQDENWPKHLKRDKWGLSPDSSVDLKAFGFDPDWTPIDTRIHPEIIDTEMQWILDPINRLPYIKVLNGNVGFPSEKIEHTINYIKSLGATEEQISVAEAMPPYPGGYLQFALDFANPATRRFLALLKTKTQDWAKLNPEIKMQITGAVSPALHYTDKVKHYYLDFRIDPDLKESTVDISDSYNRESDRKTSKLAHKIFGGNANMAYYVENQTENRLATQFVLALIVEIADEAMYSEK